MIAYGPEIVQEKEVSEVSELKNLRDTQGVVVAWIDIIGIGDANFFAALGELFDIHPLAMEDVVNTHQRPKFEEYGETNFVVLRMPSEGMPLELEQVSLFLIDGVVITVQERPGDCLEPLRQRIRKGKGRVRKSESGYLAYAVLDSVIDSYFPVFELYADRLEDLETQVLADSGAEVVAQIHEIRHDLRALRRALWPTREVASAMSRAAESREAHDTLLFLRDCYDHTTQLLDALDNDRELAASLMELHHSNESMRMNEVMKVLTIIATLFMPLGFIAGLYGMNFSSENSRYNMPELNWEYGYLYALGLMATTAIGLLFVFRKLGWLGGGKRVTPQHDGHGHGRGHDGE